MFTVEDIISLMDLQDIIAIRNSAGRDVFAGKVIDIPAGLENEEVDTPVFEDSIFLEKGGGYMATEGAIITLKK